MWPAFGQSTVTSTTGIALAFRAAMTTGTTGMSTSPLRLTRPGSNGTRYFVTILFGSLLTIWCSAHGVRASTIYEASLQSNVWQQVSIPFDSDVATIRGVFGDDLPALDYARTWVAFTYNPALQAYENPGLDDPIPVAQAFWMLQRTKDDVVLDVASTDVTDTDVTGTVRQSSTAGCLYARCAELPLMANGVAMVGMPFPSPAAVRDMTTRPCQAAGHCRLEVGNASAHHELFAYNGATNGYDTISADETVDPMQGAWIVAKADSDATLLIPDTNQSGSCEVKYQRVQPASIDPSPRVTVASTSRDDIVAAVEEIIAAHGGTLHFPPGTYSIDQDFGERTHLYFENMRQLKITGAGQGLTRLVLARNAAFRGTAVQTIAVDNYEKLEISDLDIQGQRAFMNPDEVPVIGEEQWSKSNLTSEPSRLYEMAEQQSGIFLRNGNNGPRSSTYIHHVSFRHQGADAVNLASVDNAVLSQLDIDDMGRNGITIGGVLGTDRSRNILIADTDFGERIDTQLIDVELHGPERDEPDGYGRGNLNVNVQVIGNRALRQSPRDTIDLDQYFMDIHGIDGVMLDANRLGNNRLSGSYSHDVIIQNNTEVGGGRFFRTFTGSMIGNNMNLYPQGCTNCTAHNAGFTFTETNAEGFEAISLYGNVIVSKGVEFPIRTHNARQVNVVNNRFLVDATGKQQIILIEADAANTDLNVFGNIGLDESISLQASRFTINRASAERCSLQAAFPAR